MEKHKETIRQDELDEKEKKRLQRLADQQTAIALEQAKRERALQKRLQDKQDEELRKVNERANLVSGDCGEFAVMPLIEECRWVEC
jgi:hypothetical protein